MKTDRPSLFSSLFYFVCFCSPLSFSLSSLSHTLFPITHSLPLTPLSLTHSLTIFWQCHLTHTSHTHTQFSSPSLTTHFDHFIVVVRALYPRHQLEALEVSGREIGAGGHIKLE